MYASQSLCPLACLGVLGLHIYGYCVTIDMSAKEKEVNMEQIAELLKAIGEFLSGLGAALAPIAAVAVALIAKSKPRKPLNRRRKR